ncbi:hypothetical protein ACFFGH_01855 [Lysobacter korlensis]|uniref:Lipoprotein n=1 Tax=Lysobacter korlensis TaxID=553636 RepID=A0ABV6RHX8_9GAMM
MLRIAFMLAVVAVLAACDRPPQPPDKSAPPDPQVGASARDALHAPLDRAKGVQATLDDGAQALGAQVDAAGG